VAEAPGFSASSKATGYWFPRHEGSVATSLFDAAAKFSNVIGVPLVAFVIVRFGWRWGFALRWRSASYVSSPFPFSVVTPVRMKSSLPPSVIVLRLAAPRLRGKSKLGSARRSAICYEIKRYGA
jgi:MFS family permease